MRKRDLAIRLATLLAFVVVLALYLDRPDEGTLVGTVGIGVIALVLWWSPREPLALWQLAGVVIAGPIVMFAQVSNESTGKQLIGTMLFGKHSALAAAGIVAALVSGIASLTLITRPRRLRTA